MIYIDEPDTDGHIYGIDSDKVNDLVKKLDNVTHYLEVRMKVPMMFSNLVIFFSNNLKETT